MRKTNLQYAPMLRVLLWRYHAIKNVSNKTLRIGLFDDYKDEIVSARRQLQRESSKADRTIIIPDSLYPEYYMIIYKHPFMFGGTKDELETFLCDKYKATLSSSPYDCTGQHYTERFKVAHIKDNLWKIAEYVAIDV